MVWVDVGWVMLAKIGMGEGDGWLIAGEIGMGEGERKLISGGWVDEGGRGVADRR